MLAGYFHAQIDKAGIPMRSSSDFADTLAAPLASEIDELAERSESLEQRVASLNDSYETLKKREVELTEWRWVLREAGGFFDRVCLFYIKKVLGVNANYYRSRPIVIRKIFGSRLRMMKRLSFVMLSSRIRDVRAGSHSSRLSRR